MVSHLSLRRRFHPQKSNSIQLIMKTQTLFAGAIALTLIGSAILINPEVARADYTTCANSDRLCLKKDDSGPIVQALVKDLRKAGYYTEKTTDRLNSEIETAVNAFQVDHQHFKDVSDNSLDLDIDGIVGRDTVIRLCQKVYRGCDADTRCYRGSMKFLLPCYETYQRILKF